MRHAGVLTVANSYFVRVLWIILILGFEGCAERDPSIVAYVSIDRDVAAPLLQEFTARTRIKVRAAYDSESNKTAGLVNRLIAERAVPRADVFWSGEAARTIELCRRSVLAKSGQPIGHSLDDPQGCWQGFAGRIRVLLIRRERRAAGALGLADLRKPAWRGYACIADPHFGSTGTHFAALYSAWGEEAFRNWLKGLRANGVTMLPGNAQVKEAVSQGSCWLGLTDSDDGQAALAEGAPVEIVIPDQHPDAGAFIVQSAVSLVQGAPHRIEATQLVEFLLSAEVEQRLARSRAGFLPLRHALPGPPALPPRDALIGMNVSLEAVANAYPHMLRVVEHEWHTP